MKFETEGIVLKQIKTVGGRRMIVLLSARYGKISAGSRINEGGKNKSALAMRPFTYGRYQIFKSRDAYNIDSAETIRSFYGLGEDVDKYMAASYVLEFTEKIVPYEQPQPAVMKLICDFFSELEKRESRFETLVLAYQIKVLKILGIMPELECCIQCGEKSEPVVFSIPDGGLLCKKCYQNTANNDDDGLIYTIKFDIVGILRYFVKKPLSDFKNLALQKPILDQIEEIIKKYISYHLDVGRLKSESFIEESIRR